MPLLPNPHRSSPENSSPQKPRSEEAEFRIRDALPEDRRRIDPPSRPTRVLIADDDTAILTIMEKILISAGYGVGTASDGEAAWDVFRAERFDVLVTDHDMPRLSGLELVRRLRRHEHRVPVVFISGNMPWGETDLIQLLSPGTTLQKPFSGYDLLATVRGVSTRDTGAHADTGEQIQLEFERE
jgi:DNA-binding response OmpR family regulator